ncbi:META domain-containing protein [Marinobacter caseinilyticus]|uniref:META domain-containing protein n=1 Tax=Marinobacter caseinilyticus TaxID=2692195 RepID=UPI001408E007|nr:META domain-containing protein [Marinobacter caseinilyticus]
MMQTIWILRAVSLLACLTILGGCSTTDTQTTRRPDASLTNTYWKLLSVEGVDVRVVDNQREPHLIFLDDGQVRGHTGCNSLKGRYGASNGQLAFTAMAATRMACQDNSVETSMLIALQATTQAQIRGDRLILQSIAGDTLAVLGAVYLK